MWSPLTHQDHFKHQPPAHMGRQQISNAMTRVKLVRVHLLIGFRMFVSFVCSFVATIRSHYTCGISPTVGDEH